MKRTILITILMVFVFHANAYHWTPNSGPYANTATLIGVIQMDGEEQTLTTLEVGAFCGDECRGRETPMYVSQLNRYILFMTLYGNDGDEITFRLYDHTLNQELDLTCASTVTFVSNNTFGSPASPYVLNFAGNATTSYHWTPNSGPYATTATLIGVIEIDGEEQSLTTLEVGAFCGDECRGRETPMYVSQLNRYILFMTLYGNDGDEMTFRLYDHALNQELDLTCASAVTFAANSTFGSPGSPYVLNFEGNATSSYHWTPNSGPYANTATLIGVIEIDGEEQTLTTLEVGAFCGDECRGRETPMYVSQLNRYILFMTLYGNDGDEMTFRLYDHTLNQELDLTCASTVTFAANNTFGSPASPYVLNFVGNVTTYDITVTANPSEGGTVTGAGTYNQGETATLTATASTGYTFVNWTKNGQQVSTSASYSFTVTESGNYVANFSQNSYTISATANPSEGGTVTGAGTYNHGQSCTLTATASTGYTFVNWTRDGQQVSTSASYSFTVTESGNYVANFSLNSYTISAIANPSAGGIVTGAGTYNHGATATLTATANTDYTFVNWTKGGQQVSTSASYSFTVTGSGTYTANFEPDICIVTVAANPSNGGTVTGAGTYNHGATVTLTATPNAGYTFVNWTANGALLSTSPTCTFTVTGDTDCVARFLSGDGVVQTASFTSGWNWWNTYIEQGGMDGLQMLEDGLGSNGIQIKSQQQYTNYYEGMGWMGMLSAIDNESTYKIKTNAACTVDMVGLETTSGQHPITVGPGWNWIGYPVNSSMSVATAFSNVTPASGDQVKAQNGYANYYDGMGWMGTLSTIEPGMGILYKSNGSGSFTLVYPANSKGEALVENIISEHNHWVPDMHAYPDNMTVTAIIELDDNELQSDSYELAAFANGECRGSVRLMYVEPLNRHIAFLTITGEEVTALSFSLYDTQTGEEIYDAQETLNFSNNATVGDVRAPYVLHFRGTTGTSDWANGLSVYPNPVRRGEKFSLCTAEEIGEVQVEIINALGQIETLRTMSLQTTITAPNVSGVYTLRIIKEGKGTCYRKLIVR